MGQEMEINSLTMSQKFLYACSTDKCNLVLFKYHKYHNHTTLAFYSQIFNFKLVEFGVKFGTWST